jgi:tetratricopeptide (TPR) repeat protein
MIESQEIIKHFIGRQEELTLFRNWLTSRDPEAPKILYFYDSEEAIEKKGGVGKTWLLSACAHLAHTLYPDLVIVHVDFFNVADRDAIVIANRVIEALKEAFPDWSPAELTQAQEEYYITVHEGKEDISEVRNRFSDALIADLQHLDERLEEERKYLLVFYDTYELIENNPSVAILRLSEAFPDDYRFQHIGIVFAGRNELDWKHPNWQGREAEVTPIPVSPFSPDEVLQYFDHLGRANLRIEPEDLQHIHQRSSGRPILVGLINDVISWHITNLKVLAAIPKEQFEASLVSQINQLERPIDWIVLFMAHAYHRFNFTLLDWICREAPFTDLLQDTTLERVSQQLLSLSFIRRPSAGPDFVLHDEMRPLVNRHCWAVQDPDHRLRKIISRCAIRYYEVELEKPQQEHYLHAYTVELLYHKLYRDLPDGYRFFAEHFSRVINYHLNAFARSLLREVQQFAEGLTFEQRDELKYAEARLLSKEERPAEALVLFEELTQEASEQWLKERQADIVFEKGTAYYQMSNFPEAVACFKSDLQTSKSLGLARSYGFTLNWLGEAYRRQGQLKEALYTYEEALVVQKELGDERLYASTLLSIGALYRIQGRIEEALRRCKVSWLIRDRLFKEGKMSGVHVAHSLEAIGTTYLEVDNLTRAEINFQEALGIFTNIGYKKGIATIYNRFGQIALERSQLPQAKEWFQKAYRVSLGVDKEAQIISLNKQARCLALENHYEKAIPLLEQAIDVAKQSYNIYQQAKCWVDLAEMLARTGQQERATFALQQAEEICTKYNYVYIQGTAYQSQGQVLYEQGAYSEAFHLFAQACQYMATYNMLHYNKSIRQLVDTLFGVPPQEVKAIVDALIGYWQEQGLDQKFPDFIPTCEEVKLLLNV